MILKYLKLVSLLVLIKDSSSNKKKFNNSLDKLINKVNMLIKNSEYLILECNKVAKFYKMLHL
jgi:hypothetical protein